MPSREPPTLCIERIHVTMIQFENFLEKDNYASQLNAISPVLGDYASTVDPDIDQQKEAEKEWATYETKSPVQVNTAQRQRNPISNLAATPFRALLESAGMPFDDNIVYTADDIAQSADPVDLLANTLANAYQMGNLANALFVSFDFLKALPSDVLDKFPDDIKSFIQDITVSSEPFEIGVFPEDRQQEVISLYQEIQQNQQLAASSIVLNPFVKDAAIVFINGLNIQGMSTKQIAERLKDLAKIRQSVDRVGIKDLVSSPQVDRLKEKSNQFGRSKSDVKKSTHVQRSQIQKINSLGQIIKIIQHKLSKSNPVVRSNNFDKIAEKSYARPNRRNPNDPNRPGKIKKKIYRPNIHLYLDTSMSMSIDDYKVGISAAINIAKSLKTDVYISSFASQLADPVLLDHVRSQSPSTLLKRALAIPTITGGTNFDNVYEDVHDRTVLAKKGKIAPEYAILCSDMEFHFYPGHQVPRESNAVLHLMVNDADDGVDFKTSAYNAGLTNIDKLIYKI